MSNLVSIVIPCYNQGHYLKACIESALAQDYQPLEVIVVNDGSSDNTHAVCESFGHSIYYIEQSNQGLSAARNTGIRAAKGSLIALLDSDDICLPNRISTQIIHLKNRPEVGIVVSDAFLLRDGQRLGLKSSGSGKPNNMQNFRWETVRYCPTPSTMLIRKSCVDEIGYFDTDLKSLGGEDWLFSVKMSLCYSMVYCDQPLIDYRLHPENKTKNVTAINVGNRLASSKAVNWSRFNEYPAHFRAKLQFYRFATCWRESRITALRYFLLAMMSDPRQLSFGIRIVRSGLRRRKKS